MARVIYTGALEPVLFARAKKEAEKAERIKGYRPRAIKTPAHTVIYNTSGSEVKAIIVDEIAPITFATGLSAIPVEPTVLHMHPGLPVKVRGRAGGAAVDGYLNHGIGINPMVTYIFPASSETERLINGLFNPLTTPSIEVEAMRLWDAADGNFPTSYFNYHPGFEGSSHSDAGSGSISLYDTKINTYYESESDFNGAFNYKYNGSAGSQYDGTYSFSMSASVHGAFINKNIKQNPEWMRHIQYKSLSAIESAAVSTGSDYGSATTGIHNAASNFNSLIYFIDDASAAVACDGGKVFSVVKIVNTRSVTESYSYNGPESTGALDYSCHIDLSFGVMKNLGPEFMAVREVYNTDSHYSHDDIIALNLNTTAFNYRNEYPHPPRFVYVLGSIDGFDGVLLSCGTHDSTHDLEPDVKKEFDLESVFVKSNLAQYFDVFGGVYSYAGLHRARPPLLVTDGVCLPHAWFFCNGKDTRNTYFNNHDKSRLSIVIYPQGRHDFSVDEANIVSVELSHTPRFVARPGEAISFNIQSHDGGNMAVPYVVNGLVAEEDESGNPTGFYVAADGTTEGVITSGGQYEVFRLSPRQSLSAYHLVTVEANTERINPVKAHFEVFGGGVRVQPGPPILTVECINDAVLAGQKTTFYVTATHLADDSLVRFEIKRGGNVVANGFVKIIAGAGWHEFVAPYVVINQAGGYILMDSSSPSVTPSEVQYEFHLLHDGAPTAPLPFSVKFSHQSYANSTDRPVELPIQPMFFMESLVSRNGVDDFLSNRALHHLIQRIWYSLKQKRVYVTFWDGTHCDVTGIIKKNPDTNEYEFNPNWRESPFEYPAANDPYNTKGTLEPYVYAYMDYIQNQNGA